MFSEQRRHGSEEKKSFHQSNSEDGINKERLVFIPDLKLESNCQGQHGGEENATRWNVCLCVCECVCFDAWLCYSKYKNTNAEKVTNTKKQCECYST